MGLLELAAQEPDAPALDDLTRRRSRGELVDRATRVAALLRTELGVPLGGHVAMLVGNRVELVELCLGALLGGVWMTPVNWHLTADEVSFIVADSGAGVLFTDEGNAEVARRAAGDRPVLVVGPDLDAALASVEPLVVDLAAPPGGNMFYTSGTTGRPKGVKRAPAPTLELALDGMGAAGRRLALDGAGPHLVTGPLYHAAPLGFAVMDQHNGAEMVIMPRFDEGEALRLVDERAVRNTHLVPTMFVRLLRLEAETREGFDGSSLHTVLHGAAPITQAVKRQMIEWWGPVLVEYWGASEGGVVTLVSSEEWLAHPGTVGRPIVGHEVYAGDEAGVPLPAGSTGHLWTRNLSVDRVFTYHGDDVKTEQAFAGPGTYSLGDIGRVDADGFVFLSDRSAHLIISGGVNIYPAEIEAVLSAHPAVADVAVFGVPDDEWGESVKAAVEPTDGWSAEIEAEVDSFARDRLAGYKVPRSFEVHERLPRADTGKLDVRSLRDPHWTGRDRRI